MPQQPRVHLVTYATARFRLRQILLGWSARVNNVADEVTSWAPEQLLAAGFESRMAGIRLNERGSGFWAWKPFIISSKLSEIPDGDIVFYCDVGRTYPFKLIDQPITPYLEWMEREGQSVMPGIEIPWSSPMAKYTKRDAFVLSETDSPSFHSAIPIQVSFSFWRADSSTRALAADWLEACSDRRQVSDDPSTCGLGELPEFEDHRHDQALMTLLCLKRGIRGLTVSSSHPGINDRHPSEVSRLTFGNQPDAPTSTGRVLRKVATSIQMIEQRVRRNVKFNKPIITPEKSGSSSPGLG